MKQDESLASAHLESDARFAQAVALRDRLQHDLAEVEARQEEIRLSIGTVHSTIELAAQALLAGRDSAALDHAARDDALRSESESLAARRRVLMKALELQKQSVQEIRYQVSAKISLALRPHHIALVHDIIRSLEALDIALTAESDFRNTLLSRDICYESCIKPMGLFQLGLLRDAHSAVACYFVEAERHGYLAVSDLPAHLRERVIIPASKKQASLPKETADGWAAA